MSNATASTASDLWYWLLRGKSETETAADTELVLALNKAASLLGANSTLDTANDRVRFDAFGLRIIEGNPGGTDAGNGEIDDQCEVAGEVPWALGHRPFVLMVYAKQEIDRLYAADKFGDPKLSVADESMRVIPVLTCWEDYKNYLSPYEACGVDLEQARQDLIALGLIGAPMVFGLDDDDEDDFILLTA
tara:strand:- start:1114 stop:1683 length:570 start_codon:yes stop_codon:yes gene_type:complete